VAQSPQNAMGRMPSYGLWAIEAVKETVYGIERGCGGVAVGQVANLSYAVAMTGLGKALVVDQTLWPKSHSVGRAIGASRGLQAVVAVKRSRVHRVHCGLKPTECEGPCAKLGPSGRRGCEGNRLRNSEELWWCGRRTGGNLSYAVAMTGLGKAVGVDQTVWPKGHSVRRAIGPSHGLRAVVVSRDRRQRMDQRQEGR
jgi:hypothetical protein